jgi:acetyl esterase
MLSVARYHPWVSPIEGDLADYPLAVVTAGTHDPLVDSARAFARRVREAGGRTVHYFPDGLPHGYYFSPVSTPRKTWCTT